MGHVTYRKGLYIWSGPYEERAIPRMAGFAFNQRTLGSWSTNDPVLAGNLAGIMNAGAKKHFLKDRKAIKRQLKISRFEGPAIDCPFEPPEGLSLLPFQTVGIKASVSRRAVLIGDEMGLGKTVQTIGINEARKSRRVLYVCPAFLKTNWAEEIARWAPSRTTEIVSGSKKPSKHADATIINYDILHKHSSWLREEPWDCVAFDEAHYMKNLGTLRTSHALGGVHKGDLTPGIPAENRIYLTGTPIESNPRDIFPTLQREFPYSYGSVTDFENRYCTGYHKRGDFIVTGARNASELQTRLRAHFMIRRLKKDVLKQLPPKIRSIIELQIPGVHKLAQEEANILKNRSIEDIIASYDREADNLQLGEIARIRKLIGLEKVDYCIRFIKELLCSVDKVIVFGHHQEVLEKVNKAFKGSVLINGNTPMKKRDEIVKNFQHGSSRVFVGNIQAAGVGLTLTSSHVVVFIEPDWSPSRMNQAEDRAHRIGQDKHVLIYTLVASGSMEVRIIQAIVRKQEIVDNTLDKESNCML